LTGIRTPDAAGRLQTIEWTVENQNNAIISSHTYTLDGAGKRTAAAKENGTKWDYGYNDRGEVTSAEHTNAANEVLPGRSFGYEFDDIGNCPSLCSRPANTLRSQVAASRHGSEKPPPTPR
jgi:hypothetical protein